MTTNLLLLPYDKASDAQSCKYNCKNKCGFQSADFAQICNHELRGEPYPTHLTKMTLPNYNPSKMPAKTTDTSNNMKLVYLTNTPGPTL